MTAISLEEQRTGRPERPVEATAETRSKWEALSVMFSRR